MKLICAPIATVTHAAFRMLIDKFGGCDEYYSEMINAPTFVCAGPFEKYYVIEKPSYEKIVWQITGHNINHIVDATKLISKLGGIGIDINMGCSAPEIMKSGAGAAWLSKDINETREMIREVHNVISSSFQNDRTKKRFSVKLRLGDENYTDEKFFSFCDMLVEEGVKLIALHPRTSKEKYRSPLRIEYAEKLAQRYKDTKIVFNGGVCDIDSYNSATKKVPNVYGIMIARAAIEKPWIFLQIKSSCNENKKDITIDREQVALDFIDLLEKYQPEEFWKSRMQRFFSYYCNGFSFAHYFKTKMINAKDTYDARAKIKNYFSIQADDKFITI